jgi:hypothetical protein
VRINEFVTQLRLEGVQPRLHWSSCC